MQDTHLKQSLKLDQTVCIIASMIQDCALQRDLVAMKRRGNSGLVVLPQIVDEQGFTKVNLALCSGEILPPKLFMNGTLKSRQRKAWTQSGVIQASPN